MNDFDRIPEPHSYNKNFSAFRFIWNVAKVLFLLGVGWLIVVSLCGGILYYVIGHQMAYEQCYKESHNYAKCDREIGWHMTIY